MARPTVDPAREMIAVLGAASPLGAHVKSALVERGVPGSRVALFGHEREVAVLSEYDGEARLVRTAEDFAAAAYAAVFVCEPGYDGGSLKTAAASGTLVVDLTGTIDGARLTGACDASPDDRLVSVPHPVTTLLAGVFAPIHEAIGLTRASAFVLRPASDFGEPGLEELREQTVHLLRFEPTPREVFGRQLAFNILPEHLFPEGEMSVEARIVKECRALLGAPELPLALSQALVPVFYGHAVAAHIELSRPGPDEALSVWRGAPYVEVSSNPEMGATLDASETPGILIARVDAVGDVTLRIWAVGSEAGAIAAARAMAASAASGVL